MEGIGYRPIVPVTASDLADPAKRTAWHLDKVTVLNSGATLTRHACRCDFVTSRSFRRGICRALVKPLVGCSAFRFDSSLIG